VQLLQQKTGGTCASFTQQVAALIVTRGAAGSVIHTRDAGDRDPERAGGGGGGSHRMRGCLSCRLITACCTVLMLSTGHIASLMGAIKVESRGNTESRFTRAAIRRGGLRRRFLGALSKGAVKGLNWQLGTAEAAERALWRMTISLLRVGLR